MPFTSTCVEPSVPLRVVGILQDGSLPQLREQGSLRVTDNGSFNVYSKSQEYKFTPDGLTRKGGRKAAQPVDTQLSYKVCVLSCIGLSTSLREFCLIVHILQLLSMWWVMQISEKDVRIVKVLGRGASSVVRMPPEGCTHSMVSKTLHACERRAAPR